MVRQNAISDALWRTPQRRLPASSGCRDAFDLEIGRHERGGESRLLHIVQTTLVTVITGVGALQVAVRRGLALRRKRLRSVQLHGARDVVESFGHAGDITLTQDQASQAIGGVAVVRIHGHQGFEFLLRSGVALAVFLPMSIVPRTV